MNVNTWRQMKLHGFVDKFENHYREEWHVRFFSFVGRDKIICKNNNFTHIFFVDDICDAIKCGYTRRNDMRKIIWGTQKTKFFYYKCEKSILTRINGNGHWTSLQEGYKIIDTMQNLYAEHQIVILLLVTIHEQLNKQISNNITNVEMVFVNDYLLSCITVGKHKMCDKKINDEYYKETCNVFGTCFYT